MTDVHTPPTWSNDLDQVRATVQALQGAATLLQGAMEQREALSTEMRTAEERLGSVEERRVQAEHALASATAQLARASQDLERTRSEQSGVLSEFDRLVQGALSRRGALLAEISELENRRDTLAPAPTPVVLETVPPAPLEAITHVIANVGPLAARVAAEAEPQAPEPRPQAPDAPEEDPDEPAAPLAPVIVLPVAHHKKRLRLPGVRTIVTLLLSTVLVGMAVLVTPVTELAGGLQLLAVMSGSMEPTIQVGGIVGVLPTAASDLHVGDVITFANQSAPDVLVTHRIVDVEERGGQELLTTRGDANDSADAVSVSATHAVGRVWFTLPWLGYVMFWLASPLAKLGIVAVTAIGFALTSIKRPATKAADAPQDATYSDLESEIAALLPKAS